MERLDSGSAVPERLRGGIVALGNFDGFHKGHQAVVGRAIERARTEGRPALVATFEPHPMRFFRPDTPSFRLTNAEQRAGLLEAAGIDGLFVFNFDADFASVTAPEFVTDWLVRRLGVAGVVTGQDFTFGKARGGDVALLKMLGQANRISVDAVAPVMDQEEVVSSTRIRDALRLGDCDTATRLLTRPFAIAGLVEHGDKRGRELGYPTANLTLGRYVRPRFGVYAVRGRLPGGEVRGGAASLGIRPMFDPPKELLEPYFLDFDGDLYGETIEVELISFLRDEARFDSLDALTAQMTADVARVRQILA
jgi:riboflavin kinase/FMN adenylyltransferase